MVVRFANCNAPGHPPWRGDILLLNHNRFEVTWQVVGGERSRNRAPLLVTCHPTLVTGKKRAGSVFALPAHAISIKNKHLLAIYSIPARGFTAAVSVFMGTPPPKPLNCKSVSNHRGALMSDRRADPIGEEPWFLGAIFSFARRDIIETSF